MSLYIVPRATQDFDFVVHLRPQDIDRFVENFKEGYYCDKDAIEDAVQNRRMFNLSDKTNSLEEFPWNSLEKQFMLFPLKILLSPN